MDALHGGTLVQSLQDCRSCHHTEEAQRECSFCHQASELRDRRITVDRSLSISVHEGASSRTLAFRHGAHDELACADCHTGGPSLSVPDLDCQSCHEEHHTYQTTCLDCHSEPAEDDHGLNVHATCSGSGCHAEVPVQTPPRTRDGCLWCHQDLSDHKPDQSCVSCHLMPPGGGGQDGGGQDGGGRDGGGGGSP